MAPFDHAKGIEMAATTMERPRSPAKPAARSGARGAAPAPTHKPAMGHIARFEIESMPGSPYSQSMAVSPALKEPRESENDFDQRIWRNKAHWDSEGRLVIPAMALTQALTASCKKFAHQIPGKGKKTYTAHFAAGLLPSHDILVRGADGNVITRDSIEYVDLHQDSQGAKGGGRVWRRFPIVQAWSGQVEINVLDETLTEEVFLRAVAEAGIFIGIGRWRPENGGNNGRFRMIEDSWEWL